MKLNVLHTREIDNWILERHYLKSVPAVSILRLEFLTDDGNRIGGMLWNHATSPKLDQKRILELTRMYFIDDTEHCVESKALGMARKYIRKHLPQINGLIAYSSTAEKYEGIIYLADGWFNIGGNKSPKGNWQNREGRTNRDLSEKLRFVRTP